MPFGQELLTRTQELLTRVTCSKLLFYFTCYSDKISDTVSPSITNTIGNKNFHSKVSLTEGHLPVGMALCNQAFQYNVPTFMLGRKLKGEANIYYE